MTIAAPESLSPSPSRRTCAGASASRISTSPSASRRSSCCSGRDCREGAVAATDHQTGGKGRQGRRWVAPPGSSLLVSVLLHPPAERHLPELSLVAALAAAEAIEGATGLSTQIKWPNDVMLNRRKVAGILAELSDGAVVVGIGMNVESDARRASARCPDRAGLAAHAHRAARTTARRSSARSSSDSSASTTAGATAGSTRPVRRDRRARLPPRPADHRRRRGGARRPDPARRTARDRDPERTRRDASDRVGRGAVRALVAADRVT